MISDISANPTTTDSTPDVTFVLCVESGPLETQTLLAIRSLRKWGGRFSKCPVLAITPRRGLALKPHTLAEFERLQVEWLYQPVEHEALWYGPMNKPAALALADEFASTRVIAWLDSDVLVIKEPTALELTNAAQFTALPGSRYHDLGSDGSNEHEAFWQAVFELQGLKAERYPFVPGQPAEFGQVRMYWQGGVFAYERTRRIGMRHLELSRQLIRGHIASRPCGTYFTEQVGLALAVHETGAPWEPMSDALNFAMNPIVAEAPARKHIQRAEIVHYFGSLWPDGYEAFVQQIGNGRSDVAEWLQEHGPLVDHRSLAHRAVHRLSRMRGRRQFKAHLHNCAHY